MVATIEKLLIDFYGACQTFKRSKSFVFENEPIVLLGEDHGAHPVEYVFAALDGCLIISLISCSSLRNKSR
jgi:uncharacterized OsmC-like protein